MYESSNSGFSRIGACIYVENWEKTLVVCGESSIMRKNYGDLGDDELNGMERRNEKAKLSWGTAQKHLGRCLGCAKPCGLSRHGRVRYSETF
jgi:hypothetical protein